MTPEEKLEKVEELIAARDEITAELLVLMGATDEDVEEEQPEPAPRKKTAPAAKGCPECGSPSRHKAGCSRAPAKKVVAADSVLATAPSKGRTILDEPVRLTEDEYREVCDQIAEGGLTMSQIGFSYPHIELSEIWKASETKTYREYLSK